jgi:hypothetical protein
MQLRATKKGYVPLHPVRDMGTGELTYLPRRVKEGDIFEWRGDPDRPPGWCEVVKDGDVAEAKAVTAEHSAPSSKGGFLPGVRIAGPARAVSEVPIGDLSGGPPKGKLTGGMNSEG